MPEVAQIPEPVAHMPEMAQVISVYGTWEIGEGTGNTGTDWAWSRTTDLEGEENHSGTLEGCGA